jgi:hypothetical protein
MLYGYDEADWSEAKAEARQVLTQRARERRPITYKELTEQMRIEFRHWTKPLFALLDELSQDEDGEGRGLLSALVVLQESRDGIRLPGDGFFTKTAHRLRGFDDTTDDRRAFWEDERDRLYEEAGQRAGETPVVT